MLEKFPLDSGLYLIYPVFVVGQTCPMWQEAVMSAKMRSNSIKRGSKRERKKRH